MRAWEYIVQTHLETIRDEAKRWYEHFEPTPLTHLEKSDVLWMLEGIYDKAKKALTEMENHFKKDGENEHDK